MHNKEVVRELSTLQNKCLRAVSEVYKRTSAQCLKAETHTSLMHVHLDELQAKARLKLEKGELQQIIKKAQAKI